MRTTLKSAVQKYLRSRNPAGGARAEYRATLAKWKSWDGGVPIERLGRKEIRDFLDWVYGQAIVENGTNRGRTANKAHEHLRASLFVVTLTDGGREPIRQPENVSLLRPPRQTPSTPLLLHPIEREGVDLAVLKRAGRWPTQGVPRDGP